MPQPNDQSTRSRIGWFVGANSVVVLTALWLFVRLRTQFYSDDLQHQYLATMRELGLTIRSGHWPLIDSRSWFAGAVWADPQFGIFNPVSLLWSVIVSSIDDLAVAGLLMSGFYLVSLCSATYVTGRQFGLRPQLAATVAVAMATSPFVIAINAGSWVPGLVSLSWAMWVLASLRWATRSKWGMVALALFVYLMCSAGWPHVIVGTLLLVAIVLVTSIDAPPVDRYRAAVAALAGLALGAVPYLAAQPFLEWSPRLSGWGNDWFLSFAVLDWVQAAVPILDPPILWFGGVRALRAPLGFVAIWFVLALLAIDRTSWHRVRGWLLAAGLFILLAAGPSQAGPLRWSFRFVPFAVFALLMVGAVALEHGRFRLPSRGVTATIIAGLALAAFAVDPRPLVIAWTVTIAIGSFLAAGYDRRGRGRFDIRNQVVPSLALVGIIAVVVSGGYAPELETWHAPDSAGEIERLYDDVLTGRTLILDLGVNKSVDGPNLSDIPSGAIGLFVDDVELINGYSSVPPRGLSDELCWDLFSWSTCGPEVVERLFAIDEATGRPMIDLFGLDGVVVQRGALEDAFVAQAGSAWDAVAEDEYLVRYEPTQPAVRTWVTVDDVEGLPAGSLIIAEPWYPGVAVDVAGRDAQPVAYRETFVAVPDVATAADVVVGYSVPRKSRLFAALLFGLGLLALAVFDRTWNWVRRVAAAVFEPFLSGRKPTARR